VFTSALMSPLLFCGSDLAAGHREKSATKEAVALLSRCLGEHPSLHVYFCIHTCFVFIVSIAHNMCRLATNRSSCR